MAVTKEQVDKVLAELQPKYHHFPGTNFVVCVLHTKNGFDWGMGKASALPTTPFVLELGQKYAYENALADATSNIWEKLGFVEYTREVEKEFLVASTLLNP